MASLDLEDMQQIQKELQAKYLEKWGGLSPKIGRDKLLWMMIEAGEVADIIKKKGDDAILNDPETRHHFTEEVCDVLMYLNDVLLCYGITPNEVENVYLEKHKRNMSRWFLDFNLFYSKRHGQMHIAVPNRERIHRLEDPRKTPCTGQPV